VKTVAGCGRGGWLQISPPDFLDGVLDSLLKFVVTLGYGEEWKRSVGTDFGTDF